MAAHETSGGAKARWRRRLGAPTVNRILLLGVAGVCLALLAGCGGDSSGSGQDGGGTGASGGEGGKKTIAVSFPNATKEGAVSFEMTFAREKAEEMGYEFILDDPSGDLNKQVGTIKTWINQDVDAIVTVALDPSVFEKLAKEATDAGTLWFTYGSHLENESGAIDLQQQIGGETIGKLAGDWITENADALGGKAKVVLLTYEEGEWARAREKGIVDGLNASASGLYEVVAKQDALSQTEGLDAMNTILQAHPDVNVVLAIEETATEGAYQAFINKGRDKNDPKVFLGGIDGTLRALQLLKEGNTIYRGSAALSLKSIGHALIEEPDRLLKGGTGDFLVDYTALTPGSPDVDKFLAEWGE